MAIDINNNNIEAVSESEETNEQALSIKSLSNWSTSENEFKTYAIHQSQTSQICKGLGFT